MQTSFYKTIDSKNKYIYDYVVKVVCLSFELSKDDVLYKGSLRKVGGNDEIYTARYLIYYFLKIHTGLSFRKLAKKIGIDNFSIIGKGYNKIREINISTNSSDKLLRNNIHKINQDILGYIEKWEKQTKNI